MLRCCTFSYTSDGVGWGGGWDVNVPCTSYITCFYAVEISGIVLARVRHRRGATLLSHFVAFWHVCYIYAVLRLKKYIPKELASKNSSNRYLNQKIRGYIYSFVWRCNAAKDARLKEFGTLAKTCK